MLEVSEQSRECTTTCGSLQKTHVMQVQTTSQIRPNAFCLKNSDKAHETNWNHPNFHKVSHHVSPSTVARTWGSKFRSWKLQDLCCFITSMGWKSMAELWGISPPTVGDILVYTSWWYTYPSEKYESQLGLWFPIYGKIKHVPNHQPVQYMMGISWIKRCRWSDVAPLSLLAMLRTVWKSFAVWSEPVLKSCFFGEWRLPARSSHSIEIYLSAYQ